MAISKFHILMVSLCIFQIAVKPDVRLAAVAHDRLYEMEQVCSGPSFISMEIPGNKIIASCNNIGSGLITSDKYGYVRGFEIAGRDKLSYYAKAYISNNLVVIENDSVSTPVAVHFGWTDDASDNNLYNKEGFPSIPFRTDESKTITLKDKYVIANRK
jgi:sialate O-acetylesterase